MLGSWSTMLRRNFGSAGELVGNLIHLLLKFSDCLVLRFTERCRLLFAAWRALFCPKWRIYRQQHLLQLSLGRLLRRRPPSLSTDVKSTVSSIVAD